VLIELAGARLLSDPMLRSRLLLVIRRHGPMPAEEVGVDLDAVLISHLHPDHLDFPSLRRLGRDSRVIVPAGGGRALARRGFRDVVELEPGEATRTGAVEVRATLAAHEGRRYKIGPHVEALGYELRGGDRRVYFAGDTDLFPGMRELAGGLDLALLPVAGWGPRMPSGHLDPRRAAEAAAILRPRIAVPIHWGTLLRLDLARRLPGLLSDPPLEFVAQLAELAPEVQARVLDPGGSLELGSPSS
jgi:L-ascorbate metabolism protein UlaG (beta-lactamase superfamily)